MGANRVSLTLDVFLAIREFNRKVRRGVWQGFHLCLYPLDKGVGWLYVCMEVAVAWLLYIQTGVWLRWQQLYMREFFMFPNIQERVVWACLRCMCQGLMARAKVDMVVGGMACEAQWRRGRRLRRKPGWCDVQMQRKGRADVHRDKPGSLGRPRRLAAPPQHSNLTAAHTSRPYM